MTFSLPQNPHDFAQSINNNNYKNVFFCEIYKHCFQCIRHGKSIDMLYRTQSNTKSHQCFALSTCSEWLESVPQTSAWTSSVQRHVSDITINTPYTKINMRTGSITPTPYKEFHKLLATTKLSTMAHECVFVFIFSPLSSLRLNIDGKLNVQSYRRKNIYISEY